MSEDEIKEFINNLSKEHGMPPPRVTYAITGPSHGVFHRPDHIELSKISKVLGEELGGEWMNDIKSTAAHEFCHYMHYRKDPVRVNRLCEEEKKAKDYWEAYYGFPLERECFDFEEKYIPPSKKRDDLDIDSKRGEILGCVCRNKGLGLDECMDAVSENRDIFSEDDIRPCILE